MCKLRFFFIIKLIFIKETVVAEEIVEEKPEEAEQLEREETKVGV